MEERNEELPRSNGTFQHPSSSALPGNSSQHPLPETNQDHVNADTEDQKPQGNCRGYKTYCTTSCNRLFYNTVEPLLSL